MRQVFAEVILQSSETFLEGFDLERSRPDKKDRLPDCVSMTTMRRLGLTEVLTRDNDFTQEGFINLL